MTLPVLKDFDFEGKRVLVRCDLDIPIKNGEVTDNSRIRECLPTINYLLKNSAEKIVLMGHLGRPEGRVVEELRLAPVAQKFDELLNVQCTMYNVQFGKFSAYKISDNISLLENLRFNPGEESNDEDFAKELAGVGDFYINEAFATSHRAHASIVGIPKFLPHSAGLHFAKEVESLSKVLENPKRPLVFVIGGAKPETKLAYIADFARIADSVLVGGTLCQNSNVKNPSFAKATAGRQNQMSNVKCASLTEDGFDINGDSIKEFCDIIKRAGTVVWNGPMGKYEDEKWEAGTRKIAEAVRDCRGFRVVGGGDTIAALKKFKLIDKMDYVSTGGGAMLEFLAKGTLPGIEALSADSHLR